jgi:hypothetical protein
MDMLGSFSLSLNFEVNFPADAYNNAAWMPNTFAGDAGTMTIES